MQWIIGIDEAGRGPLAGPVAVGVVKVPTDFDWGELSGVKDSKQMSTSQRELIYKKAQALRKLGQIDFAVVQVGAVIIDKQGIMFAINSALVKGIKKLNLDPKVCFVKLDGSLYAPVEFKQETIIKGDAKEQVIGLASVLAKVTRDKYMEKIAASYADYGFEQHKGYGTKLHRAAIAKFGKSKEHRHSYCKNIIML